MKVDVYAEMYLRNRSADRLIRVFQRSGAFSICSKLRIKAYQVRLEEIRAGLNANFAEVTGKRERTDESRLCRQRTAWEASRADDRCKQADVHPFSRARRALERNESTRCTRRRQNRF